VKKNPPGCANTNSDARIKLFEYLRKQPKLAKQGYPDSWLVKIKPGDTLWTYTGFGGSCSGLHSVTFVGWASDGVAQVVNGQYKKKAWYGTVCLKSTCGKRITPLVKVFRPK